MAMVDISHRLSELSGERNRINPSTARIEGVLANAATSAASAGSRSSAGLNYRRALSAPGGALYRQFDDVRMVLQVQLELSFSFSSTNTTTTTTANFFTAVICAHCCSLLFAKGP